jgi:hypothetical protein
MDNILQKLPAENESQYIWRVGQAKDSGLIDNTWEELSPILNAQCGINEEDFRGSSAWRKRYRVMQQAWDDVFSQQKFTNEHTETIQEHTRELEKAKIKLQTEKLEYNRWLREEARDELICERICSAIRELPALDVPQALYSADDSLRDKDAALIISDQHYGVEFIIKGLFGEILNMYSPEVFEARMWDLLKQVIEICRKENVATLHIYDLGDSVDGLLRVSQLMKLRYGVIESTIRYGRFMTEWLNELTKHVKVKFQMVTDANHSQLRMLGQPKNTFKNENMSYIIAEKFMDRLGDNPNFEFVQNPSGYIFDELAGYRVLGIHGEVKNMESAIKDFTSVYKTPIDILIGGHKHHKEVDNVGIRVDTVSVPSIIGVDDYSMSLNKTADAGATMLFVEAGKGISIEYNIKFDI